MQKQNTFACLLQQVERRLGQRCHLLGRHPWRTRRMNKFRAQLDAGPRLTGQQQRGFEMGDLFEALLELIDDRGPPQRRQHQGRLGFLFAAAQGFANGGQQLLQRNRLLKKIKCTDTRRLDCGIYSAVAGHHDHRHGQQARTRPLLKQSDAVRIGHPNIQ